MHNAPEHGPSRRTLIAGASGMTAAAFLNTSRFTCAAESVAESHQAMGTRAGEATQDTARVWVRLTRRSDRNSDGLEPMGRVKNDKAPQYSDAEVDAFTGACPPMAGRARLRYGRREDLRDAVTTPWVEVDAAGDGIAHFHLTGLEPGATYHYESQTAGPGGSPMHEPRRGRFETAPRSDTPSDLTFCVMTCQMYHDRDFAAGHAIYPSMAKLSPGFTCLTGDLVYYDNEQPRAVTARLARYHWERMFSLPRLVDFNSRFGTYWLKDDHDTLRDDVYPGRQMGQFTFVEGQQIFRQQAPMAHDGPGCRTFRWGRDLQVWLTEGRDDRSPNNMPDGPDKTIWGAQQKAWFKKTVAGSDATWKILISPTPLVGPDRPKKNDNHANAGFKHEGDEIRRWIQRHSPDNFFVLCGDRHWQYHSVHPETGLNEFSVGAASDSHAGGTPGHDPAIHRFHRVKGGFCSVTLNPGGNQSEIAIRLHDVDGQVVYEHAAARGV